MELFYPDLPDWTFKAIEISAGVYRVAGKHHRGATVERNGTDLDEVIELSRIDAKQLAATFRLVISRSNRTAGPLKSS